LLFHNGKLKYIPINSYPGVSMPTIMFVINTRGFDVVEKNIPTPPVVDAMKRPISTRSILIISIISAFIALWPMMFIHVDLFGGNPAIFLFLFTIPAGIVVFIVSLWLVNRFHNKSLVE